MRFIKHFTLLYTVFSLYSLSGCAAPDSMPMMPAPIVYQNAEVNPFAHLSTKEKTNYLPIFFATTREPNPSSVTAPYNNVPTDTLHFGQALVRFGDKNKKWEDLYLASTRSEYNNTIDIFIDKTEEIAALNNTDLHDQAAPISVEQQQFIKMLNQRIAQSGDKEIIIYVHGARGSFLSSVSLTAEIEHFSGRDFTGIAFSWPSHQDIINYVNGIDVERALHSAKHLRTLITFLSKYSDAKRINILCYSAGGRVVSQALHDMSLQSSSYSSKQLRKKYKLGTVLFTAADVAVENFIDRLPAISKISEKVVVTVSDRDPALITASILMKGGNRIGFKGAEDREQQFVTEHKITNFEIVDVSFSKEIRGFDITGHHYWYRNPWASSDIIILLRTDLSADHRGLSFAEMENFWYLSDDYPRKVRKAVEKNLGIQW
jgi:esterase/lipase superfamily enzyme